jgi:hypothetical protein
VEGYGSVVEVVLPPVELVGSTVLVVGFVVVVGAMVCSGRRSADYPVGVTTAQGDRPPAPSAVRRWRVWGATLALAVSAGTCRQASGPLPLSWIVGRHRLLLGLAVP